MTNAERESLSIEGMLLVTLCFKKNMTPRMVASIALLASRLDCMAFCTSRARS